MEFRIFRPIDQTHFNEKWISNSRLDHRTDIYFLFPSAGRFSIERGFKLRNEKHLELKTRLNRLANGQEEWIKEHLCFRSKNIRDLSSIFKDVRKANQHELLENLERADPLIICYVEKYQKSKGQRGHAYLESTGLRLQFAYARDLIPLGEPFFYQTKCLDQSHSKSIDTNAIESIFTSDYQAIGPMGYPEFVHWLYETRIKQ